MATSDDETGRAAAADEDRIGPYVVREEIGRGSFATVYRGYERVSLSLPSCCGRNWARGLGEGASVRVRVRAATSPSRESMGSLLQRGWLRSSCTSCHSLRAIQSNPRGAPLFRRADTHTQSTRAPVAIKAVVRSKLTSKLLENLESEISILKRIRHPHIVELKDCLVRPAPFSAVPTSARD